MSVCVWAVGCIVVLRGVPAYACRITAQCFFPCWCLCCQLYQCSWTSVQAPMSAWEPVMPVVPYPSLFPWSWHLSAGQVEKLTVCGWVYVPMFVLAMRQSCSLTGAMPGMQDVSACVRACMHLHVLCYGRLFP